MENVFRAYDIRGIFNKEINQDFAEKLGKAAGTLIEEDEFVVGYDTRASSPKLFEGFVKGMTSTGVNVISIGMVPGPVAYFHGFANKLPGVIITASHNPPEYNGFKFFRANGTSYTDELQRLKELFFGNKFKQGAGKLVEIDYSIEDYKEYLERNLRIHKPVKFVAECFNGSASVITPYIFNSLGLECIPINNKIKGDFGVIRPEPKGENLKTLKEAVINEKAAFGVAFDGDADRSVFVDDDGNELLACVPGSIFIKSLLEKEKGVVVATVDCPSVISKTINENGGKTIWCRIGHGFIENELVKNNGIFAFEMSSHFYFNKYYPFSDGILAALKMAELLSKGEGKLSEFAKNIDMKPMEKIYINAETDAKKEKVIELIRKKFSDAEDCVDGIKIRLNEIEWVLIRASQTNPEINLTIEASNEKRLKELDDEYNKIINNTIKEVK